MRRTVHDDVQFFSHLVFPHSLESRVSPEMDFAFMIPDQVIEVFGFSWSDAAPPAEHTIGP